MLGDKGLCLGAEGEVCEDDVAAAGEEELREGEVDSWEDALVWNSRIVLRADLPGSGVPEPAPVTMAVLPETEKLADMLPD